MKCQILKGSLMIKISDFMNTFKKYTPKTEDEKITMYSKYAKVRINFFTNIANRLKDETRVMELQNIPSLEFYGGNCPRCTRAWAKIEFDNMFSKGVYYLPNCDCFYYCPCCETHLYDYEITGYIKKSDYKCPFCGWYLVFDGNKRHGFEYARKIKHLKPIDRLNMIQVGHKK